MSRTTTVKVFADRAEAGRELAERLSQLRSATPVVLGLPRGGVPVAEQVAQALGAPLDVLLVRKLGVPFQPELGLGAIGESGTCVVNEAVVQLAGVAESDIERVKARERVELDRRRSRYRQGRPRSPLEGKTAVIVDDGIATGSTARAACQVARAAGASRVVLAVPVAPAGTAEALAGIADEFVCLEMPADFVAVGQFYRNFAQVSDEEVIACLQRAVRSGAAVPVDPGGNDDTVMRDEEVTVTAGSLQLEGHLTVPERPLAVVAFAHGSGSGRHSPRNRFVASVLNQAGLATLLFDLLTAAEERDRANVFDIELLAERLTGATRWLHGEPVLSDLPVCYFGASTGAAAALWAASSPRAHIAAVVSRGGRPDLARPRLGWVQAPTLLIVGGEDTAVLELNRQAQAHLHCEHRLTVIPGATHLFEEPGALAAAAAAARDWFVQHAATGGRSH